MNKKICVYTCITGLYDTLKEIDNMEDCIDYYCFTNNHNILSNTWEIIYLDDTDCSNLLLCRKIKTLGHPIIQQYDLSVWIDGSLKIISSVKEFIKIYCSDENYSMYTFKHHERNCIYQEAQACINLGKASLEEVKKQMSIYKHENYPEYNGLVETGIIVRKCDNELLKETMALWYDMIVKYTKRDQLSFNYAAYKKGFKYYAIPLNIFENKWFKFINHNSKEKPEQYLVNFEVKSEFSDYTSIQGCYKAIENNFIAEFKCPVDAERMIYNPTYYTGYIFKNLKVNGKTINNYEKNYCDRYGREDITIGSYTCIIINYECHKNENIRIEIEMRKLDIVDMIKDRKYYDNEIQGLKHMKVDNDELKIEINKILNSKSWKITKPIRAIKSFTTRE